MLIGHYAPAFVLQRVRPSVRLAPLFVATQLVDVGWGLCILGGVEHVRIVPGFTASNDLDLWDMPYTHSLAATFVWALAAGLLWWAAQRNAATRRGDAVVIAIAVASHFAGDLIVHAGDLPVLTSDGPKLGFGLWRDRTLAVIVETGLFAASALWWWWPRRTQPSARKDAAVIASLTVLSVASYFIPTPSTPPAMALTGLATYAACAAVAMWLDRPAAGGLMATH